MRLSAEKRFVRHVCCRNPFSPSPFLLEFQASTLPEAWGPWELQHAPPVLNYCIKPIPLLQLQEKPLLCKELNNCQDWAFSKSGLEAGLPASLSAADVGKMWCTAKKRFMHSHHHHSLWNSKHPLYQKLEVPESHSTLHQFWIIASSPSLCCSCRKNLSYAKNWTIAKIELLARVGWKQGCQPAFQLPMLAKCDALPKRDLCDMFVLYSDCCKSMNNCRDWAFSNNGLEVGLPAFQLPMFAKGDTLLKGDLCDMFV